MNLQIRIRDGKTTVPFVMENLNDERMVIKMVLSSKTRDFIYTQSMLAYYGLNFDYGRQEK